MVENLINLKNIDKKLNISVDKIILKIFKEQESGLFSSKEISFIFDNKENFVSLKKILNETEIVKINKDYLKQIKRDNLPEFPKNSFIFGEDIGGDLFILNCSDNNIYFSGEITFYNFVNLNINVFDFFKTIEKKEENLEEIFLKFSEEEIKILNKNNNKILNEFLKLINYGLNDIKINYLKNNKLIDDSISFIYGFEYLNSVNNDPNYFYFGETLKNKNLVLDLQNGNILIENSTFVENYNKIFS